MPEPSKGGIGTALKTSEAQQLRQLSGCPSAVATLRARPFAISPLPTGRGSTPLRVLWINLDNKVVMPGSNVGAPRHRASSNWQAHSPWSAALLSAILPHCEPYRAVIRIPRRVVRNHVQFRQHLVARLAGQVLQFDVGRDRGAIHIDRHRALQYKRLFDRLRLLDKQC